MSAIKMVKAMIVTAALVFALAITSYADGDGGAWIRDSNGWWYVNANRSYTTDNWQQINGNWYYFDSYGYLVTGWKQSPHDGKWYYLDPNGKPDQLGRMLTNTTTPEGYWVGADGAWVPSGSTQGSATANNSQSSGNSGNGAIDLGHGISLYPGKNHTDTGTVNLISGKIIKKTIFDDTPYIVSVMYTGVIPSNRKNAFGYVAAYDADGYELDLITLLVEKGQENQRLTETWYIPAGTRTIRMK